MQFRRIIRTKGLCSGSSCHQCLALHFQKIVSAITQNTPITFVLPAFPGKSPNQEKVLGILPDMGERLALQFLNNLCHQIQQQYAPGAKLILCSDGRVFSDIIGMKEDDITAYRHELDRMIEEFNFSNLSIFTLDNLYEGKNFIHMRQDLMERYGKSLESLKENVRKGSKESDNPDVQESHRIYCGITRFLFEDALYVGQQKSRTAIQKDCRIRAYEVIRRSNAWSELIAERFPDAVRLSIHPQTCGAKKLGIRLIGMESWMTPWHGVALQTENGFILKKRREAEQLGAELVQDSDGRGSHYKLVDIKYDAVKKEN